MTTDPGDSLAARFRLLNRKEMAALLGCSLRTLDRMVIEERIPYLRVPTFTGYQTRTRFDPGKIEKWIEKWHFLAEEGRRKITQAMIDEGMGNSQKRKDET